MEITAVASDELCAGKEDEMERRMPKLYQEVYGCLDRHINDAAIVSCIQDLAAEGPKIRSLIVTT